MATSETATTAAKPKRTTAPRRKPRTAAARRPRTSTTRPATRTARAQRLAERVVLAPVGAALELGDRVAGTVGELVRGIDRQRVQARKNLNANVETLTTRVERVVKDGVDAGMKLVNGAQDRVSKIV
jgi:hypothetical protein